MKTFFASLLGTLAGFLLLVMGGGLLIFLLLVISAAMGDSNRPPIEPGSYLVFDLSTNITDAPAQFDDLALMAAFSGEQFPVQHQTRLVTRALREAASDERIKGILIKGSFAPSGYGTSLATLQEVRRALGVFKAANKPIQAYLQYPDTRDFYIASLANNIALDPQGGLFMPGLASQPMFYAGAFEKFGVGVQVSRAGKFKSAVEPYTRRELSADNREQLEVLLDDLWANIRDTVAEARGIAPEVLQTRVDSGTAFLADDVVAAGLVDRIAYYDEILVELQQATGVAKPSTPFTQVSLDAYIAQMVKGRAAVEESPQIPGTTKGRVAVIYAEGAIVDGEGNPTEVGGTRFAREIRRLRQDPKIKAIVVRVNSPGGSATASEHIQRELRLAAEEMPVVISMGGYAASGGYWISAYGSRIFAEPNTITGSIGVFGMLLNIEGLGERIGLSWDTVKTGEFADALTISRPKTPAEMAVFQRVTDQIYASFIQKVSEGRKIDSERVLEIAQGRVWSGSRAMELGLVDELGGLSDAIAHAATAAGLGNDFTVTEFPQKKEFAELIAEALEQISRTSARTGFVEQVAGRFQRDLESLGQFNDPNHIYARLPVELIIQ